jgi:hypothetical protein
MERDERNERPGADTTPVLRTKVELWLVVTLMAFTLIAGLVLGLLAGVREQPTDPGPIEPISPAPPLTEDQAGPSLPPGHPSLSPSMEPPVTGAGG